MSQNENVSKPMKSNLTKITFYDAHFPVLEDGKYEFTFAQTLKINGSSDPDITSKTVTFNVDGPRFQLNSNHIVSTFPPNAGKGDLMAVLPTLVLDRTTLPWERTPLKPSGTDYSENPIVKNSSWLFLLLLDEDELTSDNISEQKNASLSELVQSLSLSEGDQKLLELEDPDLSHLSPTLNYLKINQSFLAASGMPLIPKNLSELQYLSYARIKGVSEEEHAVLLCNRLPKKGSNSTVYLISLENNYQETTGGKFDFQGLTSGSDYIFPYLYKWDFHALDDQLFCITESKEKKIETSLNSTFDFSSIYGQVFTTKEEFEAKLKAAPFNISDDTSLQTIESLAKVPGSNFHELLSNLDGGFQALTLVNYQSKFESIGSIQYRATNTANENSPIKGWYRSPFTALSIEIDITNYINMANDQRKRTAYDSVISIPGKDNSNDYDYTYSSAYELGRLIALDDADFATELYKWKCEYAVASRSQSSNNNLSHLAVSDQTTLPEIPKHVQDKFNDWKQLKGIPYRYLVPDPSLLPNESIRFFYIDQNWIKAFICGAFSLGHTIEADFTSKLEEQLSFDAIEDNDGKIILEFPTYGFLINSFAVSGWPGFEVEASSVAYTSNNIQDKSNLIDFQQRVKLDTNIELFLYADQFKGLNFHLHPGKTHSGFLYEPEKFTKESDTITAQVFPKIENDGENGPFVVDISDLYKKLKNAFKPTDDVKKFSISVFAGKMLEGTPEVFFNINPASKS